MVYVIKIRSFDWMLFSYDFRIILSAGVAEAGGSKQDDANGATNKRRAENPINEKEPSKKKGCNRYFLI